MPAALAEQRRIAEILDTVDEAIRKTEEVIAKLQQMKQGLLHDLLTRGIDDNGELRDPDRHPEQFKDSPLGRIPKAWLAMKCASAFRLSSGKAMTAATIAAGGKGAIPVYGGNGVNGYIDRPLSQGPAVVIGRVGEYCGSVHFVGGSMWVTDNALYTVQIAPDWEPAFIALYLSWFDLSRVRSQTGQPLVTQGVIAEVDIPRPSRQEQNRLVEMVRTFDARLRAEFSESKKLREVKRGLMDDLLTGRVRVNVAAAEEDAA